MEAGFGFSRFEKPTRISDLERSVVSTDPGSFTQQAIEGTQYLDRGFMPSEQVVALGPSAVRTSIQGAQARQQIRSQRASMAGQGLQLTNAAISARQRQGKIDAYNAALEDAKGFSERMEGKDVGEVVADLTPADLSNPLTRSLLEGAVKTSNASLNIRRNELIGRRMELEGMRTDRDIDVESDEVFKKDYKQQRLDEQSVSAATARIKANELKGLSNPESNRYERYRMAARAGLNPQLTKTLVRNLEGENGQEVAQDLGYATEVWDTASEARGMMSSVGMVWSGGERSDALYAQAMQEIANGNLTEDTAIALAAAQEQAMQMQSQARAVSEYRKNIKTNLENLIALREKLSPEDKLDAIDKAIKDKQSSIELLANMAKEDARQRLASGETTFESERDGESFKGDIKEGMIIPGYREDKAIRQEMAQIEDLKRRRQSLASQSGGGLDDAINILAREMLASMGVFEPETQEEEPKDQPPAGDAAQVAEDAPIEQPEPKPEPEPAPPSDEVDAFIQGSLNAEDLTGGY